MKNIHEAEVLIIRVAAFLSLLATVVEIVRKKFGL